uniref:Uncharacterized protein n=1 Tax=Timema tahoe TaxID=61484 RepID=A0A7R9FM23_9NEOP|nr:unnamed protein product [Timema tahoe]
MFDFHVQDRHARNNESIAGLNRSSRNVDILEFDFFDDHNTFSPKCREKLNTSSRDGEEQLESVEEETNQPSDDVMELDAYDSDSSDAAALSEEEEVQETDVMYRHTQTNTKDIMLAMTFTIVRKTRSGAMQTGADIEEKL